MIGLNPPRAFLAACALVLFTATGALAQDRDTLEVQRYVLTEANLAKFRQATAGMTPREYVVFSWSLFHNGLAAWAVSQPGGALPSGISRANVDFVKKHEAEIQKIGAPLTGSGCDEESDNQR